MDGRRRRYVPLDINIAFGKLGEKLLTRFGNEGLFIWMLLLPAAKKETPQGTFTYTSEPEAWTKLGAIATSVTLNEFFTFTGQLKKTRRTCVGRVQHVSIRGWEQWNKVWETEAARERSARKRAETTRTVPELSARVISTEGEGEYEGEGEVKTLTPNKDRSAANVREIFTYWQTTRNHPKARLGDDRRRKILARLRDGFDVDELKRAVDGVALDPWEDRGRHDDIGVIFRNGSQVEKFLALHGDVSVLSLEERRERHLASLREKGAA